MNAIIVVNKRSGLSSSMVVQRIKKLTQEKCGHLGTLDPLAEGVLPVAIGRATRLFDYFLNKTKTYVVEIRFGYETDTLDEEGEIKFTSNYIPTEKELTDAINNHLLGEIMQIPPQFSSKKINGERAYKLARKGESSDLKAVPITIYSFFVTRQLDDRTFEAEVTCSSGTYIRSLCRDLGRLCSSYATMFHLLRTKCGPFNIQNSVLLDKLSNDNISQFCLPLKNVLSSYTIAEVTSEQFKSLIDGKKIPFSAIKIEDKDNSLDDNFVVYLNKEIVGIAKNIDNYFKIQTYLI